MTPFLEFVKNFAVGAHIVLVIAVCMFLTIGPLTALVAWMASVVAYENGHYDHKRLEPTIPPYHPEYHSQLRGRDLD